jgi:hypothetical protein
MQNSFLGIEAQVNHQVQSYYLPKTILKAKVTVNATTKALSLTTGSDQVVDRQRSFRVNYVNSLVHEDDIFVVTDTKGFLVSVQSNSTDKTADIVEDAAKIFMSTITGKPVDLNEIGRALTEGTLPETELLALQFDPFDADDFGGQNAILQGHGYCFAVFDRKGRPLPGSCSGSGTLIGGPAERNADATTTYTGSGFFYRRPAEHRVVIFRKSGKTWRPFWAGWHPFEQQADLHEVRIDRGNFIKFDSTLTFTKGYLKNYVMKKDSELLGFMKIPATIVNTVVAVPGAQAQAAVDANTLKERELNAREKELQLRERELKLVPAGVTPDGRQSYVPAGTPPPTQGDMGIAQFAAEKQRFFALCTDQQGLNAQDCDAAWTRRNM